MSRTIPEAAKEFQWRKGSIPMVNAREVLMAYGESRQLHRVMGSYVSDGVLLNALSKQEIVGIGPQEDKIKTALRDVAKYAGFDLAPAVGDHTATILERAMLADRGNEYIIYYKHV